MIKAHKRKNSGSMRRASRVYLTDDADHNAAKNLEYLGLAGVYSLRLLPN
jgi:hypothetical protein